MLHLHSFQKTYYLVLLDKEIYYKFWFFCFLFLFPVIADGAMIITVVIHQDLLHFSVIQVVQISDRIFRPRNQIQQNGRGLDTSDELMLKNTPNIWSLFFKKWLNLAFLKWVISLNFALN